MTSYLLLLTTSCLQLLPTYCLTQKKEEKLLKSYPVLYNFLLNMYKGVINYVYDVSPHS